MTFFDFIDLSDILDIVIVSMFIYAGLIWFKKTRAFLVVAGIVILGVIYALARFFDLFLTSTMLQGFFAVLLIAIIIIFQEELRHFFERIALWGLGRKSQLDASPLVVMLVRTAVDFARGRIGALIVISGRDPIDRHVEGGNELDGKISEALLRSIFDRSSPGHDGAVIIKDGRIARFATHLPLSKDLHKLTGLGTRHAAAIGLCERCDALCIVVSEERGVVSVARDGELKLVTDNAQLGPIINGFLREKFPPRQGNKFANLLKHNLREKIVALLLAVALWATFAYNAGTVSRDFYVPIEYSNLSPELVISNSTPKELAITVSGDERAFKLFGQESIKAAIDLSNAKEGLQHIQVFKSSIKIPRNFKLNGIKPSEIDITLKRAK